MPMAKSSAVPGSNDKSWLGREARVAGGGIEMV